MGCQGSAHKVPASICQTIGHIASPLVSTSMGQGFVCPPSHGNLFPFLKILLQHRTAEHEQGGKCPALNWNMLWTFSKLALELGSYTFIFSRTVQAIIDNQIFFARSKKTSRDFWTNVHRNVPLFQFGSKKISFSLEGSVQKALKVRVNKK